MPLADSNRESLAGLTLDDVLANRAAAASTSSHQLTTTTTTTNHRTLLDIIREDESSKKNRKPWKDFKDKLRLKRAESAWASSVLIPASDIPFPIRNFRNLPTQLPRRSSVRVLTFSDVTTHGMADPTEEAIKSSNLAATMMTRQRSTRQQVGDAIFVDEKLKPQMSRGSSRLGSLRADSIRRERVVTFRDSNTDNDDDDEDGDGQTRRPKEERQMSAREAVAAQEAAEAAAAAQEEEEDDDEEEDEDEGPFWNGGGGGGAVTMSLMDLLEETDRQMGLEGSTYRMDDDDDDDDDFDEDEDDYEEGEEHDCCVCMVKHRGAPFEPCGHSFCRMCSRELTVSKGNCPLCNNFILEILEVF